MSPNKSNIIYAGHAQRNPESIRHLQPPSSQRARASAEFEAGRAEGLAEARRELEAHVQAFTRLAGALPRQTQDLKRVMDQIVTRLSLQIAARIVEREVKDPEVVKAMVARALREVPLIEHLAIRLSPEDAKILEECRGRPLTPGTVLPDEVVLIADRTIARGGCLVENGAGKLDARVETQLQMIGRALLGEQKAGKNGA